MKLPDAAVDRILWALTAAAIAVSLGFAIADSLLPDAFPAYLTVLEESEAAGVYLIDINTADAEHLSELPGIGKALAQRIVDFREAHGPYSCKEDLTNVPGISERMLEQVWELITY